MPLHPAYLRGLRPSDTHLEQGTEDTSGLIRDLFIKPSFQSPSIHPLGSIY